MARLCAVFFMMTLLTSFAFGQEAADGTPSLITKSPFLPPGFEPPGRPGKAAEPPPQQAAYEFRGVYLLGDTYYFNLYNKSERKGSWIAGLDGGNESLKIVDFNSDGNELVIDVAGERVNLNLIETSDKSIPIAGAKRPAANKPAVERTARAGDRSTPARRRVIRPSSRSGSRPSAPGRRRVIRPTSNE